MTDWMKWGADMASYAKQAANQASTLVAGSELEKKLAEATSNEPWGASGTMLSEIARATYGYEDFKTVVGFVWRNAALTGSLWRVVYKTLNMLDYLLRHGSDRVIEDARDHLREIKKLQKFEYVDPTDGKDQGANVREKARQLVARAGGGDALLVTGVARHDLHDRHRGLALRRVGVLQAGGVDGHEWQVTDIGRADDAGAGRAIREAAASRKVLKWTVQKNFAPSAAVAPEPETTPMSSRVTETPPMEGISSSSSRSLVEIGRASCRERV